MFTINQGFDLNSPQFNFKRDYFASVADLKAAPETSFPDHFITNVAGVLYQLTKSNSVDDTTGKWRKVQLGSDVDLSDYVTKENAVTGISSRVDNDKLTIGYCINNKWHFSPLTTATHTNDGVMSVTDKVKLDGIAANANNYTLPTATTAALGGIKTGYKPDTNRRNYSVRVDESGNAYVYVPLTPNDVQYVGAYENISYDKDADHGDYEGIRLWANAGDAKEVILSPSYDANGTKPGLHVREIGPRNSGRIYSAVYASGVIIDGKTSGDILTADGGTIKSSTFALDASVDELRDNVIKNKGVTAAEDGTTIQANTFKITGNGSGSLQGVKFASNSLTVYDNSNTNNQSVIISNTGIKTANNASASTFFATNGSTQSITAISTEELNKIFV